MMLAFLAGVAASACSAGHAFSPTSTPPVSETAPYALLLEASPGLGSNAGHAGITVRVRTVRGVGVPDVSVVLQTSAGALEASTVRTDAQGIAMTVLSGPAGSARVVAAGGGLSADTLVALQPTPPPIEFPVSTPPAREPFFAAVSAFTTAPASTDYGECAGEPSPCYILPVAVPVRFHISVTPSVAIASVEFSFGDGTTARTGSLDVEHRYSAGGLFTIGATVTSSDGRTAQNAVQIRLR